MQRGTSGGDKFKQYLGDLQFCQLKTPISVCYDWFAAPYHVRFSLYFWSPSRLR